MVGEAWINVSNGDLPNIKHYRTSIETKRILPFNGILTNLRKYCLQMINLQKLKFVSKNWPNDTKVGCKSPFGLVELIEKNL
jgi:hypothetical protein